jgi:hypothetical protein
MSLELAAQHLASRGRKGDSMLVHMAPQEVSGLQALAKAHGGSLTLNPDTGLPEASFLKNLLPTLIGAGLAMIPGVGPLMAAGIVGGGTALTSGSLQKGLMAGLGAYGGAGLAGGLSAAGTVGAEAAAGAGALGTGTTAIDAAMANAFPASSGAVAPAAGLGGQTFAQASQAANAAAANQAVNTAMTNTLPLSGNAGLASQVATATPMPAAASVADRFAQAGKGFGALGTEAGRSAFMGNAASEGVAASGVGGGMGLMKSAYAAALPMMMQEPAKQGPKDDEKPYEYDYDPGRISDPEAIYTGAPTGERRYFDHRFTRRAADGGLMGLGTVQAMSDRNMAETMAANGGRGFASGGVPVEQDPYYTMSGQSGDAFKYLMGQAPASRGIAALPAPDVGVDGGLPPAGDTTEYDYTFDPVTGRYSRTVKPIAPVAIGGLGIGTLVYDGGGGYDGGADAAANAGFATADSVGAEGIGTGPGVGGIGGETGVSAAGEAAGGAPSGGGADNGGDGGSAGGDGSAGAATSGDAGWAKGGLSALARAQGGASHLGDYSDGGRLLKGPGDGVSDSIPATIANKRPARLADGEFVVPARIVSELGNGSTEAGARKLYAMMDRIQKARGKTTGKNRVAVNSRAAKLLPA